MRSDLIITRKFAFLFFIAYICCVHYLIHMQKNHNLASGESSFTPSKGLSDGQLSMEATLFNAMETRTIEGYPNYFVSDDGKVFTKDYYGKTGKTKQLRTQVRGKGYIGVTIYNDGKPKTFSVHRLIAMAFIPNPKGYNEVNHINSKRNDNRAVNLEWCNQSENIKHGYKYGNCIPTSGEKSGSHILIEEQVLSIRQIHASQKISRAKLSVMFNISQGAIQAIIERKSWKHI